MRKLAVKIWLTIAAFFLSATVSVADCSSNANQCTPKQLCSAATSTEGGVKVWSKSSYYSKHVSKAKQVGINCGVVEIVASCDNDPELCSVDDLCKQSVQKSGGKTGWKTSSKAAGHIALAKEFGLKCGVTEPVAKKKTCAEDVRVCTAWQLCPLARSYKNGQNTWAISSSYLRYVTEAKRRGLTCGVTETVTKKKTCAEDTRECKTADLCAMSTYYKGGVKVWSLAGHYVPEAKRRGLTCGVTETVAKKKTCAEDVRECNASELCNRSTYYTSGVKVWNLASKYSTEAKRRGLTCGVTETVAKKKTCSQDVRECNTSELCKRSTYTKGTKGTKAWKVAGKHVTEAKRRGLTCGVTETVANWKDCSKDASVCNQEDLCRKAILQKNNKLVWDNKNSMYRRHMIEAKRRGLDCGVTETIAKKKTCAFNPEVCSDVNLCAEARSGVNIWENSWETSAKYKKHVTEAKRRGLTCGVTETIVGSGALKLCPTAQSAFYNNCIGHYAYETREHYVGGWSKNEPFGEGLYIWQHGGTVYSKNWTGVKQEIEITSNIHTVFPALKSRFNYQSESVRKSIQSSLKRKGLYSPSIDGQWGRATLVGLTIFSAQHLRAVNLEDEAVAKLVIEAVVDQSSSSVVKAAPSQTISFAQTLADRASSASTNIATLKSAFRGESVLKRKQIQYALRKLNYYNSSIDAQYGPGTERALTGYANAKGLNGHSPHSIFSSVLNQVSVPSSFAVAKRSNNSSSSSSSSSSGGSSAGRTLLQGLFVAGACSLTSNPGACLDGATGNNRSSNTGSSSKRSTLRSGTYTRSGNTIIGPTGEAYFTHGRVFQGTDGTLCHNTRNAIICN